MRFFLLQELMKAASNLRAELNRATLWEHHRTALLRWAATSASKSVCDTEGPIEKKRLGQENQFPIVELLQTAWDSE